MNLFIKNLKPKPSFIIISIFFISTSIIASNSIYRAKDSYTDELKKSITDSVETNSKKNNRTAILPSKKDTLERIAELIIEAKQNQNIGKYSTSFNDLWEGLYLANSSNNNQSVIKIHTMLSKLYVSFNLNDAALIHLQQGLNIAKKIPEDDPNFASNLIATYMNLGIRQRSMGNYQMALNYLDTCLMIENQFEEKEISLPFFDAEIGYVHMKTDKLESAYKFLTRAYQGVYEKKVNYKPNLYLYLGEYHLKTNNRDSAVYYFNKSIDYIKKNKGDLALLPEAYLLLSNIYKEQKKYHKALIYLNHHKEIKDSLIEFQLNANSDLFEVKNSYLKSIKEKDNYIISQQQELDYQKQIQSRLKIISILIILLGIAAFAVVRIRLKLKKTLLEKNTSELEAKLSEKKIKGEVELKSKELTSYALQMIDKDTAIDELLDILKKEAPSSYKPLQIKYKKGAKDLWDQFNLRFTEVNTVFYNKLNTKHPDLSPTERKHCALIKLNFGTKEMARILNIAPHSVHITRSRMRKKMGLDRSESLEKYIANL
ncbi:tetratricopeptide repeat protein [Labilibacter marinus]|uniref:tetratricopeptide repeat protein n=1 Tax=Labilibacter marinus TaxID=1477105 RepID=UPI00082D3192|nr:tetratricopeptide repeat protein [Labilibacter marinus]